MEGDAKWGCERSDAVNARQSMSSPSTEHLPTHVSPTCLACAPRQTTCPPRTGGGCCDSVPAPAWKLGDSSGSAWAPGVAISLITSDGFCVINRTLHNILNRTLPSTRVALHVGCGSPANARQRRQLGRLSSRVLLNPACVPVERNRGSILRAHLLNVGLLASVAAPPPSHLVLQSADMVWERRGMERFVERHGTSLHGASALSWASPRLQVEPPPPQPPVPVQEQPASEAPPAATSGAGGQAALLRSLMGEGGDLWALARLNDAVGGGSSGGGGAASGARGQRGSDLLVYQKSEGSFYPWRAAVGLLAWLCSRGALGRLNEQLGWAEETYLPTYAAHALNATTTLASPGPHGGRSQAQGPSQCTRPYSTGCPVALLQLPPPRHCASPPWQAAAPRRHREPRVGTDTRRAAHCVPHVLARRARRRPRARLGAWPHTRRCSDCAPRGGGARGDGEAAEALRHQDRWQRARHVCVTSCKPAGAPRGEGPRGRIRAKAKTRL